MPLQNTHPTPSTLRLPECRLGEGWFCSKLDDRLVQDSFLILSSTGDQRLRKYQLVYSLGQVYQSRYSEVAFRHTFYLGLDWLELLRRFDRLGTQHNDSNEEDYLDRLQESGYQHMITDQEFRYHIYYLYFELYLICRFDRLGTQHICSNGEGYLGNLQEFGDQHMLTDQQCRPFRCRRHRSVTLRKFFGRRGKQR